MLVDSVAAGAAMVWAKQAERIAWSGLLPALVLLLGACGSLPDQTAVTARGAALPAAAGARADLVRVAARQIGTPYRYGGNTRRGFDCSGLVQFAHRQLGIEVPRTTVQQWRHAHRPARPHLVPGDLVFFSLDGDKQRHVGIYEGGGVFIHAPSSGKTVSRASLDNPFWQQRMIGARSFL